MEVATKNRTVPKLRFTEFEEEWGKKKFDDIFIFSTGKNIKQKEAAPDFKTPCVRYGELYHMYDEVITEVVNKTNLDKSELRFSDGDEILLPSAGEDPLDIGSASALMIKDVAIGRTINILKPLHESVYSQIYASYYINHKLRKNISTLAKGVSISNVYNSDLKSLTIILPTLHEQIKIVSFLTVLDNKIQQLTKKAEGLAQYKKGVMEKIFKQELRFKEDNGSAFEDWEERKFNEVLTEHKNKSTGEEEVYSVSVHKGLINQIEHLGRSFAAKDTSNYNLAKPNDIIYTKSPTGNFPFGIIKQSFVDKDVIISPLYGVFTPETAELGYMLNVYFESVINVHNYLHSIIQKGAKNTINITNTNFLSKGLKLPVSKDEQIKIGSFLKKIDTKINQVKIQLAQTKQFKKGLLQQMFV
jgi:type I restriction enzyme S subunit